jgi:hypothetical protein
LNERFENEAILHGPYSYEPRIHIRGPHLLTPAQEAAAIRERSRLGGTHPNDPHALLYREPNWKDNPPTLHVDTLDFAAVRALRNPALNPPAPPQIISANALLLCRDRRELILHRRAEDSDTYPNALHTVGGAYWPPNVDGREADRLRLRNTALREVLEETEAALSLGDDPPMVVLRELRTGFVQLAFLGVNVSAVEAQRMTANREGSMTYVGFDELPSRLRHDASWVPTGKAAVLAWLAQGAPGAGKRPRFGGLRPTELFTQLVS